MRGQVCIIAITPFFSFAWVFASALLFCKIHHLLMVQFGPLPADQGTFVGQVLLAGARLASLLALDFSGNSLLLLAVPHTDRWPLDILSRDWRIGMIAQPV